MGLVALSGGSAVDPVLVGAQAVEDFEQEIVDQYALAMAAAGLSDGHVGETRAVIDRVRPLAVGPVVGGDRARTPTGSWPSSAGWGAA